MIPLLANPVWNSSHFDFIHQKQGGLKSWWILIWELFWGRMWQEMPPSLMCFITFQAKMVQWKQVTWGEMLAWKWWIQSCLRWESSVGFPCHLVSLCFVAHHFIKLTLISSIESLGISASADFWLIVLTDKVMLWCYTYYRVNIYILCLLLYMYREHCMHLGVFEPFFGAGFCLSKSNVWLWAVRLSLSCPCPFKPCTHPSISDARIPKHDSIRIPS